MESSTVQTPTDVAPTRAEWERWRDVANAACAEVGVTPNWQFCGGRQPSTDGGTQAHYRSACLADMAVGFDRRAVLGGYPVGYGACWPCWEANAVSFCAGITYAEMLVYAPCSKVRTS